MSWMTDLGLWMARQGGWQEPVILPLEPCAQCAVLTQQTIDLGSTIDRQAVQLAQQVAELSARPTITARCENCADVTETNASLSREIKALQVEGQGYKTIIERLSQESEDRKVLLSQSLESLIVPTDLVLRAKTLSAGPWAESQGGESKRHQVYAKLIKEFPEVPKRKVGLAIELALHRK